ncbi:hypothetical protein V7S43_017868 [Phytophthora oleae]|uniref:Uncharacterized protein n=1 Tax=Phytophthora oleae TaxID=2107226 RepID=A0ABD3ERW2_9STRA
MPSDKFPRRNEAEVWTTTSVLHFIRHTLRRNSLLNEAKEHRATNTSAGATDEFGHLPKHAAMDKLARARHTQSCVCLPRHLTPCLVQCNKA